MHSANQDRLEGPAGPATGQGEVRTLLTVCALLAVATIAVFGRSLDCGFVNYDDNIYVYNIPAVTHGLTVQGVARAFSHGSFGFWDPLTTLSHMLDCEIYGLDPAGHHLTNVVLHTASVILLFLALQRMTGALWPSAFVAALFAIHPLRVESVVWITERKDVLSGFFFMLTLMAYVRYVQGPPSLSRYLPIVVCFALGLMSKAMIVTLPFVLLLLDYWPLNRFGPPVSAASDRMPIAPGSRASVSARLILEKVPLLMLSAGAGIATVLTQNQVHAVISLTAFPFSWRLDNALASVIIYVRQMFWPFGLEVFYPFPSHGVPWWSTCWKAVLLGAVTMVAVLWRRKHPCLLVGWLWYLLMLAPVIGLLQAGAQAHADRYTYLPQIGLYLAVTGLVSSLCADKRYCRMGCGLVGGVVVVVLAACAWLQTGHWRDSASLWKHTLACDPNNLTAHYNLGVTMLDLGRDDAGISELETALKIQPDDQEAHNNLGFALFKQGKVDEAMTQYELVLKSHPGNALAHYDLGVALAQKGQQNDAISQYEKALVINPDDAKTRNNLGTSYLRKHRMDDAIIQYQKALAIEPDSLLIRNNYGHLAWVLATSPDDSQRNGAKALAVAQEVLQPSGGTEPDYLAILAAAYAETGNFPTAIAIAARAQELAVAGRNMSLADAIQHQLAFYRVGRPFRDPSLSTPEGKQ